MRARFSIPALLFPLLAAATACSDTSPRGILDPGGAALLVVAPSAATIKGGATLKLNLTSRDEDGLSATPSGAVWTTSNPRIASVAQDGVVTGRDAGGTQITAYWNGIHGVSTVTVTGTPPTPTKPGGCGDEVAPKLALQAICVAR